MAEAREKNCLEILRFNEEQFPSEWLRSNRKNIYNTGDVEAALASFQITVDIFKASGLCAMVAALCEKLPSWPLALQVEGLWSLTEVLETRHHLLDQASKQVLQACIMSFVDTLLAAPKKHTSWKEALKDGDGQKLVFAWCSCFRVMCTWTDVHIIQAELLPKALEATTQSTDRQRVTRVVAAAMLGSMGAKMLKCTDEQDKQAHWLACVALCSDKRCSVRTTILRGLWLMVKTADHMVARLRPYISNMLTDSAPAVREVALHALVEVLDMIPPSLERAFVVLAPIQEFFDSADFHSNSTASMAQHLPGLISEAVNTCREHGVGNEVQLEQSLQVFLKAFQQFARGPDAEARQTCASQSSSILKLLPIDWVVKLLQETLPKLVKDSSKHVCLAAAKQILAVSQHIQAGMDDGSLTVPAEYLTQVLLPLMEHDIIPVRIAVVTNLSDILRPVKDQQEQLQPVFTCLLWADVNCAGQWRIQQQMLLQYAHLCTLFDDAEMDAFVDRALAFLQGGAAQVRTAAAEAVIALLRHCPHEDQRTHIYHELLQNCAADAFASHRLMFLEACIHAAACFSHRVFVTYFWDACATAVQDPVVDVRLRFCCLLPVLKKRLRLSSQPALQQQMDKMMQDLCDDPQAVVQREAAQSRLLYDAVGADDGEDAEDDAKQQQEHMWTLHEEVVADCMHRVKQQAKARGTVSQPGLPTKDLHRLPWSQQGSTNVSLRYPKPAQVPLDPLPPFAAALAMDVMPGSSMAPQHQPPSANTTAQSGAAPDKYHQRKKVKGQTVPGSTGTSSCNMDQAPSLRESALAAGQLHAATTPRLALELSPTLTQSSPLAGPGSASLVAADGTTAPVYLNLPTTTSNINTSPGMTSLARTHNNQQHLAAANGSVSAILDSSAAPDHAELTSPQRLGIHDVTLAAAAAAPTRPSKTDACLTWHVGCGPYQSSGLYSTQPLSSIAQMATSTQNTDVGSLRPGLQWPPGMHHPTNAATPTVSMPSWAAGGFHPDAPRPSLHLPTPHCPTTAAASSMGMPSRTAGGPQPDSPRPSFSASLPPAPSLQGAAALPDPPRLTLPTAMQAIFANTSQASGSASPSNRAVAGLGRQEEQLPMPHIREATTAHPPFLQRPSLDCVGTALVTHSAHTAVGTPAPAQSELNLQLSPDIRLANAMAPRSVRLATPAASLNNSMPPGCGGASSSENTRAGLSELVDLGRQMVDMGEQILHAGSSIGSAPGTVSSHQVAPMVIDLTGDDSDNESSSCSRSNSKLPARASRAQKHHDGDLGGDKDCPGTAASGTAPQELSVVRHDGSAVAKVICIAPCSDQDYCLVRFQGVEGTHQVTRASIEGTAALKAYVASCPLFKVPRLA